MSSKTMVWAHQFAVVALALVLAPCHAYYSASQIGLLDRAVTSSVETVGHMVDLNGDGLVGKLWWPDYPL